MEITGTGNGPKVRVYSFPKDDVEAAKWLRAIKRDAFKITPHSKFHFQTDDFEWQKSGFDEKTGKRLTDGLQRPKLIPGRIPSILPNLPKYLSSTSVFNRKSPNSRRKEKEEDVIRMNF